MDPLTSNKREEVNLQKTDIILLKQANIEVEKVGAKTKNLAILINQDIKVPDGFCITTSGYKQFIEENQLAPKIDMEIYKKSSEDMRWEEIWDASLRIRAAFLRAKIPLKLKNSIVEFLKEYDPSTSFSVRSSSPVEDSRKHSFAGIHDSYVNISSIKEILKSIKMVWASLWSDRAILYREELELDSINSSIAVLIQEMVEEKISGLAFSQDPRGKKDHLIIEAIEGLCSELVDNEKEPEKWIIRREDRKTINHSRPSLYPDTLLAAEEKNHLLDYLFKLEDIFKFPVDVEWTGTGENLTILQSRPITSVIDQNQERQWYLTLTPSFENLKKLADKVEYELIIELENEGNRLSEDKPYDLSKEELADKIKERAGIYDKWKKIYWDEFIPFAHGIRNFGTYYNDLVKPDNPYEFMELLKNEDIIASKRNKEFEYLSTLIRKSQPLQEYLKQLLKKNSKGSSFVEQLKKIKDDNKYSKEFIDGFLNLIHNYMDISFGNISLQEHPETIIKNLLELAQKVEIKNADQREKGRDKQYYLEKLYRAAGDSRQEEVDEVLRIGRLSWKLRDDDNLLLGKVENQFLKFLKAGAEILEKENRLENLENLSLDDWPIIYKALRDDYHHLISLKKDEVDLKSEIDYKPRQLVGQPSSPGISTGKARIIKDFEDFSSLQSGEILVCDAIQPQMTFLISLASGIVERRGGMLVHSSIIAREMGIPAVNGISKATELIKNGELITVNGYLGLVVIGEAEFELEHSNQHAGQI